MKKAVEIWAEYAHACAFKTAKSNAIQLCEAFFEGWPEEKLELYREGTGNAVCTAKADMGGENMRIEMYLDFQEVGVYRLFAKVATNGMWHDFTENGASVDVTAENIHELMAFALKGEDVRTAKPM